MREVNDNVTKIVLPVFIAVLLLLGILLLVFPGAVQRIVARSVDQGVTAKWKGLKTFVGSNAYLWNVRIVGLLSLLMGLFLLFAHRQ